MSAYYNEIDPYPAQWLRNLIAADLIAPGDVDERDIQDIKPSELIGYDQCHFFAGIGVWSYALRRAGWPDSSPVWTGSCPCQPFSATGKGGGFADERHLWPSFFHLIQQCAPSVVFGEQVASPDGLAWLDLVQSDMEGAGNAVIAFDLCAAGFGAPHIRQRLYWLGYSERARLEGLAGDGAGTAGWPLSHRSIATAGIVGELAHANDNEQWQGRGYWGQGSAGLEPRIEPGGRGGPGALAYSRSGQLPLSEWSAEGRNGDGSDRADDPDVFPSVMANATGEQRDAGRLGATSEQHGSVVGFARHGTAPQQADEQGRAALDGRDRRPGATNGFWRDADWLLCRDERWRPVRPGSFPLVNGATARVGRLRAYGNAIVAPIAEEFIAAWMECRP